MFLLETTHQEIVASNNAYHSKKVQEYIDAYEALKVKQARELETAKYNYDTKLARAENEKRDTVAYKDQRHKEDLATLKAAHNVELINLESKYDNTLSTMKAKYDAKEIELTQAVRNANNEAELTRSNAALVAERIEKDAESRIKTAEQAASVVLANAQLEALHVVAAGKAKGEELSYQIAKAAQENAIKFYEDIIDVIIDRCEVSSDKIDLSEIKDIVVAATQNFPKVTGDATVNNTTTVAKKK